MDWDGMMCEDITLLSHEWRHAGVANCRSKDDFRLVLAFRLMSGTFGLCT